MEFLNAAMEFREFIAWILLLLVAIIFRFRALIDGGQWVDLMKTVTLSFFGVHSVQHFTDVLKTHLESKIAALSGGDDESKASGPSGPTQG